MAVKPPVTVSVMTLPPWDLGPNRGPGSCLVQFLIAHPVIHGAPVQNKRNPTPPQMCVCGLRTGVHRGE